MPNVPFTDRKSNVCDSFDEHGLAVGSFNGLELGRLYFPTVFFRKNAPGYSHIAAGINEPASRDSHLVRAAVCESRDAGLLASAACGLQKGMERLARLQAYDG